MGEMDDIEAERTGEELAYRDCRMGKKGLNKVYKMIVTFGTYSYPGKCEAVKVEQVAQGYFKITKLEKDFVIPASQLLSIVKEAVVDEK